MTPTPESGGGLVRSHDEWRALAAAYSIDALDATERAEFDAHLAECAECRALLASFAPVVEGLGRAIEPEPLPAALRAKTIARAASQPQARTPFGRAHLSVTSGPVTVQRLAPSWWIVGASVAATVALAIYSAALRNQVDVLRTLVASASAEVQSVRAELASVRRDSRQLLMQVSVLSAADIHRVDLAGQARASLAVARAYVSPTRGLMFSAEHLPALAAGHVYQIWVLAPTPISAGVLTPASDGSATAMMPMPNDVTLASITAVAVTEEPTPQGSAAPTMPILLVGNVGR